MLIRVGDNWLEATAILAVIVHRGEPGSYDGRESPCVSVAWAEDQEILIPCPTPREAVEIAEGIAAAVNAALAASPSGEPQ